MVRLPAALGGLWLLLGCGAEQPVTGAEKPASAEATYTDPDTGTTYEMNLNRRVLLGQGAEQSMRTLPDGLAQVTSAISADGTSKDESGMVQVQIVECDSGAMKQGSISIGCSLSPEYVLIGGGAEDVSDEPGAMLWESRPNDTDDSNTGTTWLASSKDHHALAWHRLHVWAVGLRLKKTDGSWMPRNELKQYVNYRVYEVGATNYPSGTCSVPLGARVVGGGARANAQGHGQLLTASYPSSAVAWTASSKDHMVADPSTLSVYCIGIKPNIPGFGNLLIERVSAQTYTDVIGRGTASGTFSVSPKSVPGCYGGVSEWALSGRMLYRMGPADFNIGGYTASSKDHFHQEGGRTFAWGTQLRKQ
jgi:hypothetical protein